ncbi:serpin family protein [Sedimentibacter sp. zth1]|uniref:serpin family protein n=1 Tax=Sedimentibacter sp. zth1 TaxID=2816908 RepID=UPI001A91598C|nr:serpin family protein [Sedimentibacter sp. zth1]QSX06083.1 serpin family protein [Sedimentibacter sp. zth1]
MKKIVCIIILILLGVNTVGCEDSNAKTLVKYPDNTNIDYESDDEFIKSANEFACKTAYEILTDNVKNENINYSPISVYFALSLAATGANDSSKEELFDLLCINGKDKDYLSEECYKLFNSLYFDKGKSKLKIANSLWLKNGIEFKDEFIINAVEKFYASLFNIDFSSKKELKKMTEWVSDNTNNLLNPTFEPDKDKILSIINTIYFYDTWLEEFKKQDNTNEIFYLPSGEEKNCVFMNKSFSDHKYYIGENYISSSLDFENCGSIKFILPNENVEIADLLESNDILNNIMNREFIDKATVNFKLPKFQIESKFDIKKTLQDMGVEKIFNEADFSDMTDKDIFISDINQGTYISLDEKGVEAAAYTEIGMKLTSVDDIKIIQMTLNRPFIYVLTAKNGTILFVGVCSDPTFQ